MTHQKTPFSFANLPGWFCIISWKRMAESPQQMRKCPHKYRLLCSKEPHWNQLNRHSNIFRSICLTLSTVAWGGAGGEGPGLPIIWQTPKKKNIYIYIYMPGGGGGKTYVKVRMYHIVRLESDRISGELIRQKLSKLILQKNL